MRYCKQRLVAECGPIAIINSAKWAGIKVSYKKDMQTIRALSDYLPEQGIEPVGVSKALRKLKIKYQSKKNPLDRKNFYDHIGRGYALILCYDDYPFCYESHVEFFDDYKTQAFKDAVGAYTIEQVWYLWR